MVRFKQILTILVWTVTDSIRHDQFFSFFVLEYWSFFAYCEKNEGVYMKVIKKINNNIVMAKMRDGSEVFVVGRGLGFRQTPFILNDNDEIIEKIFTQQDKNADKYMAIFTQIPYQLLT